MNYSLFIFNFSLGIVPHLKETVKKFQYAKSTLLIADNLSTEEKIIEFPSEKKLRPYSENTETQIHL